MRRARWIRLELADPLEQWPVVAALSHVQARESAPIVLWSRFGALLDGEAQFGFAFIVPVHVAPGKTARWTAWALSPAVATYREFGLRAYLSDADICMRGRRIADSRAERVNGCAVIAARLGTCVREAATSGRAAEFRAWLRAGLGIAPTQWDQGALPERTFETALRTRIEAQHEWQFENSWPDASEQRVIGKGQTVAP
ncbi:MAG: hypothetical protein ACREVG_03375 [Burkholderiales bacterium]